MNIIINIICSIISKNKLYEIIDNVKIHGRDINTFVFKALRALNGSLQKYDLLFD